MLKMISLISTALFVSPIFAQKQNAPIGLVWLGTTENPAYETLANKTLGVKIRTGEKANTNEIAVRAVPHSNFIEVKHQHSQAWLAFKLPDARSIEGPLLVQQIFSTSNCDQVNTVIELTSSTPKTQMYFNSKPIGEVHPDGRFYFESQAVCRNEKIELSGTLPNCKDFTDTFIAVDNPHRYKGRATPDCAKKS